MSEFQKGLVIGMLIIIGCATFIVSRSNNDVGRYIQVDRWNLLDTKTGDYYLGNEDEKRWILKKTIKNYVKKY